MRNSGRIFQARLHAPAVGLFLSLAFVAGPLLPLEDDVTQGSLQDLSLLLRHPLLEKSHSVEVFSWHHGPAAIVPAHTSPIDGGTLVRVPGGCVPGQRMVVVVPGEISAPLAIESGHCSDPGVLEGDTPPVAVPLEMLPSGTFEGRLRAPAGHAPPETGHLVLLPCIDGPEGSPDSLLKIPFHVEDDASWRAPAPAGCWNVTLLTPGFAAETWAQLAVPPESTRGLGEVHLTPDASILAQVTAAESGRPLAGARVDVVPPADLQPTAVALVNGETSPLPQGGITDERGWVRLSGLAPGRVFLRITAQDRAPLITPASDLEAGREWVISEPFEVGFPASLQVGLQGGREAMDDSLVIRAALTPELVCGLAPPTQLAETLEPGGVAEFPDLLPGTWNLELQLARPDGLAFSVARRTLDLEAGGHRNEVIELGRNFFTGTVTHRGVPIRASLGFDPEEKGTPGSRIRAETDEEGRFRALLPEPGLYTVWVRDLDGILPENLKVPGVRFEEPGEPVLVELPEGRLQGVVLGPDGHPMPEALVNGARVEPPHLTASVRTDEDGNFVLDAIGAGPWSLTARGRHPVHGPLRSRALHRVVEKDEEVDGLRLRLTTGRTLAGRVLTHRGRPAAGIRGALEIGSRLPEDPGVYEPFTTDDDGRFRVTVQDGPQQRAHLRLYPRGLPISAFVVPVQEGLELRIPENGGSLEVLVTQADEADVELFQLHLVDAEGAVVRLVQASASHNGGSVVRKPLGSGEEIRLQIPSLSPGAWQLVAVAEIDELIDLLAGRSAGRNVASFTLRPGVGVQIEVPPGTIDSDP